MIDWEVENYSEEHINDLLKISVDELTPFVLIDFAEEEFVKKLNLKFFNKLLLSENIDLLHQRMSKLVEILKVVHQREKIFVEIFNHLDVSRDYFYDKGESMERRMFSYLTLPFEIEETSNYKLEKSQELKLFLYAVPSHWSFSFAVVGETFKSYENTLLVLKMAEEIKGLCYFAMNKKLDKYRLKVLLDKDLSKKASAVNKSKI